MWCYVKIKLLAVLFRGAGSILAACQPPDSSSTTTTKITENRDFRPLIIRQPKTLST